MLDGIWLDFILILWEDIFDLFWILKIILNGIKFLWNFFYKNVYLVLGWNYDKLVIRLIFY